MHWVNLKTLLFALAMAALCFSAPAASQQSTDPFASVTPLYIAQLNPGADTQRLQTLIPVFEHYGLRLDRVIAFARADLTPTAQALRREPAAAAQLGNAPVFVILDARDGRFSQAQIIAALMATGTCRSVERDSTLRFSALTSEVRPRDRDTWHLYNWSVAGADINATTAWEVGKGTGQTISAIIDDGIFALHPDLAANMWRNPGEIENNGLDDDGDGLVDNIFGADFGSLNGPDGDPIPIVENSHGTQVAGMLGAVGDNGPALFGNLRTVGANPNTKMMAIKVASSATSGFSLAATLDAYAFVAQKRAAGINVRVVNASYGGPTFSQAAYDAINYLGTLDILLVAAAGNGGTSEFSYPASYDLANVISVAASNQSDQKAPFSNFGPRTHLFAPGDQVLTTSGGNSYERVSGTSFAAPLVTATATLVWDVNPSMTAVQVRQRILGSVDALPELQAYVTTHGRLNMGRALGIDLPSRPPPGSRCVEDPGVQLVSPARIARRDPDSSRFETSASGSSQRLLFSVARPGACFHALVPLEFVLVLPNGLERPITDLRPARGGFSGLVDLSGVPPGVVSASVRLESPWRYRLSLPEPRITNSPIDPIDIAAPPGEMSASLTSPTSTDVTYFNATSDLGAVGTLQPGWAFVPAEGSGAGGAFSAVWTLPQPLLMMGASITHLAVTDAGNGGDVSLFFCTTEWSATPPSGSAGTDPWGAPTLPNQRSPCRLREEAHWLTLRLNSAFFTAATPNVHGGYWRRRKQAIVRSVEVRNASGQVIDRRHHLIFAMSAGLGGYSSNNFAARDDWGVRITFADSRPQEIDVAIVRRTRDLPDADHTRIPVAEVYFRGRNYQLALPSLAGAYTRSPHANGAFYTYQQGLRITTTAVMNPSFSDTPSASAQFLAVEAAARTGLMTGCGGGAFCPSAPVTRGEAAAAFARALLGRDSLYNYATAPPSGFADLPPADPVAHYVGALASRNILTGCGNGNFCPDANITRAELAQWLTNVRPPSTPRPIFFVAINIGRFPDVPAPSETARAIEYVAGWGVMGACDDLNFCPTQPMSRGDFATLLERAFMPYSLMRGF